MNWYRLNSKPSIEYSTDFNFFIDNQISVVKSGRNHQFQSRLESKTFRIVNKILHTTTSNSSGNFEYSHNEIVSMTREIHEEVLSGKHGEGKLVN